MEIRIGDIVRFLSEKTEGKVTSIIDNRTVNVYCENYGFEIPASVNDLVVIRSDLSKSSPDKDTGTSSKNISVELTNTLYLALVPDNFNNLNESRYDFYLVNDTSFTCLYAVSYYDGEKYSGITAGNCEPEGKASILSHSMKEIDRIKSVRIEAIFYRKGNYIPRKSVEAQVKIIPTSLCKSGVYKHVRWFSSMTLLRPLEVEEPIIEVLPEPSLEKALKEKKAEEAPKRPQKQIINNTVEVDLHIEQLLETTTGMSNRDILEYQLDIFRKTLEEYKLRKGQKIIFIHGKGDGVLHQRILWELQTHYKRFHHQDASFKQYGYGATLVTIK